jgi:hypothetical protein
MPVEALATHVSANAVVCSKADAVLRRNPSDRRPLEVTDLVCRFARGRIARQLGAVSRNGDRRLYRTAQDVAIQRMVWRASGIA